MQRINKAIVTAAMAVFLALPAVAQEAPPGPGPGLDTNIPCAPMVSVLAEMASRFGEAPAFTGVVEAGPEGKQPLLVLTMNPNTGTFTVLSVAPGANPIACMIVSGTDGQIQTPEAPGVDTGL